MNAIKTLKMVNKNKQTKKSYKKAKDSTQNMNSEEDFSALHTLMLGSRRVTKTWRKGWDYCILGIYSLLYGS